jgi:hypothetical protein
MQRNNIKHNDVQHNDIQHKDIQHNDIQLNDIQHNDIQHNDIQHNDIQPNDIQHNDIHHNGIQPNDIQHGNKYKATLSIMALLLDWYGVIMPGVANNPFMLSVVGLNVIMLCVVAPLYNGLNCYHQLNTFTFLTLMLSVITLCIIISNVTAP